MYLLMILDQEVLTIWKAYVYSIDISPRQLISQTVGAIHVTLVGFLPIPVFGKNTCHSCDSGWFYPFQFLARTPPWSCGGWIVQSATINTPHQSFCNKKCICRVTHNANKNVANTVSCTLLNIKDDATRSWCPLGGWGACSLDGGDPTCGYIISCPMVIATHWISLPHIPQIANIVAYCLMFILWPLCYQVIISWLSGMIHWWRHHEWIDSTFYHAHHTHSLLLMQFVPPPQQHSLNAKSITALLSSLPSPSSLLMQLDQSTSSWFIL